MTVEQLIEKLKEFPQYREVRLVGSSGASIVEVREMQGLSHPVVVIR